MIIVSLFQNIALLITLLLLYQYILRDLSAKHHFSDLISGLLFGIVAVMGMMTPFHFVPGIIFDGRSVVLSIAGLFGGPIVAGIAATMAALYRMYLGGAGAVMGVSVIIEASAVGVLFHYLRRQNEHIMRPLPLWGFGMLVHVVMLMLMITLPGGASREAFRSIAPPVILLFPVATMLVCRLFLDREERRTAVSSLAESEQRYRALFENNHAPMLLIEPETGTVLDANPAACMFYGWPIGVLRNKRVDSINILSMEEINAEISRARRFHRNCFQFQHRLANGEIRDVEVYSGPISVQGRSLLYSLVFDVTERLKSQAALKESEQRFRVLVDNAPDGIFIQTCGRFTYVNTTLLRILGEEGAENMIGQDVIERFHPEYQDIVRERIRTLNQDRNSVPRIEEIMVKKDGAYIDVEISAVPFDWGGENGALVFVRDITDRKQRDTRIAHLNRVLRAVGDINQLIIRENRPDHLIREGCQLLIENRSYSSALIILTDAHQVPTLWAQAGLQGDFEDLENTLRAGQLPECCRELAEAAELTVLQNRHEVCKNCPVVRECPSLNIMCAPLRHEDVFFGFLVIAADIDISADAEEQTLLFDLTRDLAYALHNITQIEARVAAEQARDTLEDQLIQAQKMEAVGRLAGGIAHDFNNNLQTILGYTELCFDSVVSESELEEYLVEIRNAGERSALLTRQLLAFARKQTIEPKVLDLNDTIVGMLKMLGRLIGEDIDLLWKPGHDTGYVKMDPAQVDQILANLVVNARDAIAGVGKITIETANVVFDEEYCEVHLDSKPGRYVMLAVSDNGAGMSSDITPQIFEPFFTTKGPGKGTGLGLSMVYGIVRQNGGFVNVYSELGRGTVFRIYFPLYEDQSCGPQASGGALCAPEGSETILLVEDETFLLELTRKMLERLGYTVLPASNARQAEALLMEHGDAVHLLLTDVVMPDINGRDLWKKLSAIQPELRCLFMSGYTANVIAHHGVLDDNIQFIAKPFTLDTLANKVREALV